MTLNEDNTPQTSDAASEKTQKPARRRVTRAVSSPTTPVQFLTAETPAVSAPKTTVGNATVVTSQPIADDASAPATPRRSRRVTSSGKASTSSVAVSGTAHEIAAQTTSAHERSAQENQQAGAQAPQVTATQETDTPADKATRGSGKSNSGKANAGKKTGASKKKAATRNDASTDADSGAQKSAENTQDTQPVLDVFEDSQAPKKTRKRNPRSQQALKDAVQSAVQVQSGPAAHEAATLDLDGATDASVAAPSTSETEQNADDNAGTKKAPARNRTRSRSRATAPQDNSQAEANATDSSENAEPVSKKNTEEPKRGGRGRRANVFSDATGNAPQKSTQAPEVSAPARPRLATTALLFQAPDLSAVPARSVGAQIDSPQDAEEETEETAEETTEETAVEVAETATENQSRNRRERGRNRNRNRRDTTEADDAAVTAAEESAEEAEAETPEEDEDDANSPRRRRRRGGRGRRNRSSNADAHDDSEDSEQATSGKSGATKSDANNADSGADDADDAPRTADAQSNDDSDDAQDDSESEEYSSRRRRRRRRRGSDSESGAGRTASDEVTALKGSTRLEAKRQRRREGRDAGRRRTIITEAEFLARRESVERSMVVRERNGRTQIAVLEDGVLVEHYVSQQSQASMAGNVYLGRVQNVLPSMEAAFVDIGKGRNAVLYAGEVNWDVHGVNGQPRRIEDALKSGDSVLVQVTKDPIGHKGARLTSQITLAGRYLVFVPGGGMTGISRKLPDTERNRLKRILKEVLPEGAGVIVRTAAEGASEEELTADIARLRTQWESIEKKSKTANAPALLQGEPDLAIRVVRDIFNDDFTSLKVQGSSAWEEISQYVNELAPDLAERVTKWVDPKDIFAQARIDEQLTKGMDRKVWLPSGGSLVIDRTEAMTVIDVNTGKFTGAGGTLEETVTRNNIESAEEIVRQLRLRDIGGIIVIDFIDMVLESNRDLVLRRLVECLGRDRTKHQVAEVTSLGLVQMTRKRVGQGLVEAFSTNCDHCNGRGFIVHEEPNEKQGLHPQNSSPAISGEESAPAPSKRSRRKRANKEAQDSVAQEATASLEGENVDRDAVKAKLATIAAAAASAHDSDEHGSDEHGSDEHGSDVHGSDVHGSVEPASVENASDGQVSNEQASAEHGSVEQGSAESLVETAQSDVVEPVVSEPVVSEPEAVQASASKPVQETDAEPEAAPLVLDVLAEFGVKPPQNEN